ncbi:MAG: hypothetical protein JNM69_10945 [Archangium sp.]|nr:hypothetical protein [Archangium sp.]
MKLRLLALVLIGCSAVPVVPPDEPTDAGVGQLDAGIELDAGVDAGIDAGVRKQANCASQFGTVLTNAFGRVDGTVVAVVPPGEPTCAVVNGDHVVVQVNFDGGVHRMVVNIESSFGDPRIRMRQVTAPLPPPAFEAGWHPGLRLDYPSQLNVHSDGGWEALTLQEAATRVYDLVEVGAPISVYATSTGGSYASSAHKVHRNGNGADGALVLNPTSASPTWVLFHFANQSF